MREAYGQAGAKTALEGGISGLEQRVQEAQHLVDGIFECMFQLQGRLYPPRPSPVNEAGSAPIAQSLENGLNMLNTRLTELRRLSEEILRG